jgi:hypothetical protein
VGLQCGWFVTLFLLLSFHTRKAVKTSSNPEPTPIALPALKIAKMPTAVYKCGKTLYNQSGKHMAPPWHYSVRKVEAECTGNKDIFPQ